MDMSSNNEKLIAVIGATRRQGGAVVRALQAGGQFKVRALTRSPGKHRVLADAVVEADLDRPKTLTAAFEGADGVFLVTNFWEGGTDERKQATAAVRAAKDAGVKQFIWSTLPNVGSPTDPWAGLFLLIQGCVAFTWAISANSATSLPGHSHTRIRQAMASICPSSEIS